MTKHYIAMEILERFFYNTGQALFAVERFRINGFTHTIVYDCGGDTKNRVNVAIDDAFDVNCTIDALFISHYDRDHINGVHHLLNRCNVRHVFLPLLNKGQELWLNLDFDETDTIYKLYYNDSGSIRINDDYTTRIHKVDFYNPDNREDDILPENGLDSEFLGGTIRSGQGYRIQMPVGRDENGVSRTINWVFITHNINCMNDEQWESFVTNMGFDEVLTPKELVEKWKAGEVRTITYNNKKAIKRAAISSGIIDDNTINAHSMTLYSGPVNSELYSDIFVHTRYLYLPNYSYLLEDLNHKLGGLYTGDYDVKSNMKLLKKSYNKVWKNIGTIQIPHHGSENNFYSNLILRKGIYIIPIEKRNGQVKPALVEDALNSKKRFYAIVNETLCLEYYF